MTTVQLMNEIW